MAKELLGRPVADAITSGLADRVTRLVENDVSPTLAIIRVGERDDDLAYERGAMSRCQRLGIGLRRVILPDACAQDELMGAIRTVNDDPTIHGCLMFRPLPAHLDEVSAASLLAVEKDVDGITAGSLYGVFANRAMGFAPCTAEAVIELLAHYGYELRGERVTVVGRSLVIGRPVSMLLQAHDATVTMCHTKTRDLARACKDANIVVVGAGHAGTIRANAVRHGQVIVDVGINWDADAKRLVGDVAYDEVAPIVDAITPVPRGVGSVTTSILAAHVVTAAERSLERSQG